MTTGMTLASATCGVIAFAFEFPQRLLAFFDGDEVQVAVVPPVDPALAPLAEPSPMPVGLLTLINADGAVDQRVAGDLPVYFAPSNCPDLRLKLNPISQRDTPAEASASGQPGVYLAARLTVSRTDSTDEVRMVGNGKGPAAFEDAYEDLLDSAIDGMTRVAPDCLKGSVE